MVDFAQTHIHLLIRKNGYPYQKNVSIKAAVVGTLFGSVVFVKKESVWSLDQSQVREWE